MKKVFVKSYGCQMNVYDAERMADILAQEGYHETDTLEEANLIILNTCHIREKAADKVYSELGRIRQLKEERVAEGHTTHVVVAGCVAQAEGREILRRASAVDVVVGPQSYHHLPQLLRKAEIGPVVDTEFPAEDKFDYLPSPTKQKILSRGVSAFLTIQEGCDKFCSFCVVPYTRGAQVSRSVKHIVEEARRLSEAGIQELTLIGQNVNAYDGAGADGHSKTLGYLLRYLAEHVPVRRLRYTTSHPKDMDDELIAAHRDLDKLMPYLHLPVQSGSDRILTAMNRQHSAVDFLHWIDKIRNVRPDIALSSDFIVGFPGETDEDFEDTLKLVKQVSFASSFSFKYSPRPGTPAAEKSEQINEEVKTQRLHQLQALLEEQRQKFNQETIGKSFEVLFEKPGRHSGQLIGKTPYLQAAHINTKRFQIGDVAVVRAVSAGNNSLFVEELDPPQENAEKYSGDSA